MKIYLQFAILLFIMLRFDVQGQNIDGRWILQITDTSVKALDHDTITIKGKRFETTISNGVINSGKIKKRFFKKNEFKLKSCLYYLDDGEKCSVSKWEWKIISLSKNSLVLEQTRRVYVPGLNSVVYTGIYEDYVTKLVYTKIP